MNEPGTTRHRLRDFLVPAAAVTTVLAVIGVTTVLTSSGTSGTVTIPGPEPAPVAMRLVGFGHAAIAVPKIWGTNFSRCGTPRKDTVLIDDPSASFDCRLPRPEKVESVELTSAPPADFRADERLTIDGVEATRQRTACLDDEVCWGAVGIPSQQVWFHAVSSTGAEEVDRILDRIQILPNQVGLPSYQPLDKRLTGTAYAKVLAQQGLKTRFLTRTSPRYLAGRISGVSPAPGTMLTPGSTVTVTVVK